jgi:DNA polymerase-3 subunit gamma/tau
MAYEVTATRRRPQRFEDMIGQEFVVATLQKSISAGKIAHAYLFSGPRGCGKTSSARILAKALNCENGPSGTPCGTCVACTEITRGSSLDVIEIDGASNTSVNDVRQIKEEVQFPPNSCRYKVYIIDEVHMLSTSAFNALLKTIEEPPPYVIFIFATTELHKVPATIKSRCQQFNFRLVSVDALKNVLAEASAESGLQAEDEALFWIAREATGSVRDAYTLFDQVAAFSDGVLTFDKIRDKLGLIGVDRLNPLIEACANGNSKEALLLLDDILQSGVSVEQCSVDLADYLRNILLIKAGIEKEALLGQKPDRFSGTVLQKWNSAQIERALSLVLQLFRDIRYSLDVRYELELCIARIAEVSSYVSLTELKTIVLQTRHMIGGRAKGPSDPFDQAVCEEHTEKQAADHGVSDRRELPPVETESAGRLADPFAELKKKIGSGVSSGHLVYDKAGAEKNGTEKTDAEKAGAEKTTWLSAEQELSSAHSGKEQNEGAIAHSDNEDSVQHVQFAELQGALADFFQATKNMIAAALLQSFDWKEEDAGFVFSVDKPFTVSFLEQEMPIISSAASRFLGKPVIGRIILDTSRHDADTDAGNIPERVETIRRMFRGTIV